MSSPQVRRLNSNKKRLAVALPLLALAGLVVAWFFAAPREMPSPDDPSAAQPQAVEPRHLDPQHSGSVDADSVGAAAEQQTFDPPPAAEDREGQPGARLQEAELEHLRSALTNSLYPVFRDDFQLNMEGVSAINAFVASMPPGLGGEDLDSISALIESQLPGPASEDLAFIITHLYRLEQEEARMMNELGPATTMADQMEAQEQLAELRDDWFGPELSEQLFSGTDDAGDYASEGAPDSEPEGSSETQTELASMEGAWEQRYQEFLAEKQIIDRAGLDEAEKERQIEDLLQQHYAPEEVDAARAFDEERRQADKEN